MSNKLVWFIIGGSLLTVLAWYFFMYSVPNYTQNDVAPDFQGVNPKGDTIRLSDFQGDYVLLDFWASWCAPCRQERHKIVKLYNDYKKVTTSGDHAFKIISIGLETNREAWLYAIKKDMLYWNEHVSSFERMKDPIAELYGVNFIPMKFLISPEGKILVSSEKLEDVKGELDKVTFYSKVSGL